MSTSLATQHTGQSELHYSDNFTTAHLAVGKATQAVHCVWEWPAAISHWPAKTRLWGNNITMQWMKNASRYIFQHISSLRVFHPVAMTAKNGQSGEQTNKKATYHSCHSFF